MSEQSGQESVLRDEIIRMAREAWDSWDDTLPSDKEFIERFAALVAAAEREACALLCEKMMSSRSDDWQYDGACVDCANAIRARGGDA